jgi:Tetratricopeptide repeat
VAPVELVGFPGREAHRYIGMDRNSGTFVPPGLEGDELDRLGLAYADLGDTRRAIDYHEQQIAIAHVIGNRRGEGNALMNIGLALRAAHRPAVLSRDGSGG